MKLSRPDTLPAPSIDGLDEVEVTASRLPAPATGPDWALLLALLAAAIGAVLLLRR